MSAKTALITGASSGIGKELSYIFAQYKTNLVIVARNIDALHQIASDIKQKYGVDVAIIPSDLGKPDAALDVYNKVKALNISVDYIVNNAGFGDFGHFADTSWEKEHEMIEVNITALTQMTKLFVRDMVTKGGGKIMNLASTAAFQPGPLMAVYYATKAYVLSFSEAIANELKDQNITVTALCPGATESGFEKASNMEGSRLFNMRKLPSSAEVALFGYNAMMRGQAVAIQGLINKIMVGVVPFSPRKILLNVVKAMNGK